MALMGMEEGCTQDIMISLPQRAAQEELSSGNKPGPDSGLPRSAGVLILSALP